MVISNQVPAESRTWCSNSRASSSVWNVLVIVPERFASVMSTAYMVFAFRCSVWLCASSLPELFWECKLWLGF